MIKISITEIQKIYNANLSRIDITKLYEPFLEKVLKVIDGCAKRGVIIVATEGHRSPERQTALYAQGRTTKGSIVTYAQAYESYHQYGLAIDFVIDSDPNKAGVQPDWNKESYKVLQEECHKAGLRSGLDFKNFKEAPHVEYITNLSKVKMKEVLLKSSIKVVWTLLDNEAD